MRIQLLVLFMAVCTSHAVAQQKFSKLVWADEFEKNGAPDSSKWVYDMGDGGSTGWGNNELQQYTKDARNVRVENGLLVIEALKEKASNRNYTSTRIKSMGKGDWTYGRFEIKAKLPKGRGTWPAIWMLPTKDTYGTWPASGEIDIMEHVGYDPGVVHGTIHTEAYNHIKGTQKEGKITIADAQDTFHTYVLEWDATYLKFYVDDKLYHTVEREAKDDYKGWPFDKPFHIILNIAVGGNWGGQKGVDDSIWPQRMEVDFVRVYQ